MEKLKSHGKCIFCNKDFAKASITRHLSAHLKEKAITGAQGKSFQLKIEVNPRYGSAPYFLSLWMDGIATLNDLDNFLRRIWLNCCGHMSAFTNPKNARRGIWSLLDLDEFTRDIENMGFENRMDDANGEIPMERLAKEALTKDLKLNYEYDFGSTTKLQITVVDEFPIRADEKIVLLSRNEPLEIMCEKCGKKPATQLCTICMCDGSESAFCDSCAKKHAKKCNDFADYAAAQVVNSPRMGVCAYDGGTTDTERDGVYKMK